MGKFRKRAVGRYIEEYKKNNEIKFNKIRVVLPDWSWTKDMGKDEALDKFTMPTHFSKEYEIYKK